MKTLTIEVIFAIGISIWTLKLIRRVFLFAKRNSQVEKEFFDKYYTIKQKEEDAK